MKIVFSTVLKIYSLHNYMYIWRWSIHIILWVNGARERCLTSKVEVESEGSLVAVGNAEQIGEKVTIDRLYHRLRFRCFPTLVSNIFRPTSFPLLVLYFLSHFPNGYRFPFSLFPLCSRRKNKQTEFPQNNLLLSEII